MSQWWDKGDPKRFDWVLSESELAQKQAEQVKPKATPEKKPTAKLPPVAAPRPETPGKARLPVPTMPLVLKAAAGTGAGAAAGAGAKASPVLPPQASAVAEPWWVQAPTKPVVEKVTPKAEEEGLWYQIFGRERPEWLRTASEWANYVVAGMEGRVKAAYEKPEERYRLRVPGAEIGVTPETEAAKPTWGQEFTQRSQALQQAEGIPSAKEGITEAAKWLASGVGRAFEPVGQWWEKETAEKKPLRQVEQVLGAGVQALSETPQISRFALGLPMMYEAGRKGIEPEKAAPIVAVFPSLVKQQLEQAPLGGMFTPEGTFTKALAQVKAGQPAEEVAAAQYDPVAEILFDVAADPLNALDILQVGNKLRDAKRLTKAEKLMVDTIQASPEAAKMTATWVKDLARHTDEEATILDTAIKTLGVPAGSKTRLKNVLDKLPWEMTPLAKAERDLSEFYIVTAGPLSDAENTEQALAIIKRWATDPESLRQVYGGTVSGPAGKKAQVIFAHLADDIGELPAAKAQEYNPQKFMMQLTDLAEQALKQVYGYKEPNRVQKFLTAYKGIQSEFLLSGTFNPAYVVKNTASDLFTMSVDGVGTFEKRTNIDGWLEKFGLTTKRLESRGAGAKAQMTGISEGQKSKLPWVLGDISEAGQRISRHGEVAGRLPIGEEPRYQRAVYSSLKRFYDTNALKATPDVPAAVRQLLGDTWADNAKATVAAEVRLADKRKALDAILNATSPGEALDPMRYLDTKQLDDISPEMMKEFKRRQRALGPDATDAQIEKMRQELIGLVDSDEAERLKDLEILPVRKTATDVEEAEVIDASLARLREVAEKSKDPQLVARANEIEAEMKAAEQASRAAREAATEAIKEIASPEAVDIMYHANSRASELRVEARKSIDKLMNDTVAIHQSRPGGATNAEWQAYFFEKAKTELELAHSRAAVFQEANQQLARLAAGEKIEDILTTTSARKLAEERLLAVSQIEVPEGPRGWMPASVKDATENEKFQALLAEGRALEREQEQLAWREVYNLEPQQYGDGIDTLQDADAQIAIYGKQAAAKVEKARAKAFKESKRIARQRGADWQLRRDKVWEDFYAIRNDTWREYRTKAVDRWKVARRDVALRSFPAGARPELPEMVKALPGDEALVKQALRVPADQWTPEVRAAVDRWSGQAKAGTEAQIPLREAPVQSAAPVKPPDPLPGLYSRDQWRKDLRDVFDLSDEQATGVERITDARAETWAKQTGRTPQEWYAEKLGGVVKGGEGELFQFAQRAPQWYYKAEQIVTAKMPNRAGVDQVRSILTKGGVKADELEWSGVLRWLDEQKGSVSKEDVLGFLQENRVQVQEVTRSAEAEKGLRSWTEFLEGRGLSGPDLTAMTQQQIDALYEQFGQQAQAAQALRPVYARYTLPGGQNYRELLLTLPQDVDTARLPEGYSLQRGAKLWEVHGPGVGRYASGETEAEAIANFHKLHPAGGAYRSSHWEEPNVLAHVRFNERTADDGARVLFIEEVQSDWHQTGREVGYRTPELERKAQQLEALRKSTYQKMQNAWLRNDVARSDELTRQVEILDQRIKDIQGTVPAAPFAKSWEDLTAKRMIRWAAENDFDRIAWTTGAQQVERYPKELRKVVDRLEWVKGSDGAVQVQGYKGTNLVFGTMVDASGRGNILGQETTLADAIGKQMAEKMLRSPVNERGLIKGPDFVVGDRGLARFYDEKLPNVFNDLGKKYGARVADAKVQAIGEYGILGLAGQPLPPGAGFISAHSLSLTPEMKQAVLAEGQPLFQAKKGAVTFVDDGRAIIRAYEGKDVSTVIHEVGHVFRRELEAEDLATATKYATGARDGKWTVEAEEKFARAFERYLADGMAPTPELQSVFERFKEWLLNIYKSIAGSDIDVKMDDQVRGVFDRLLAEAPAPRPGDIYGREMEMMRQAPLEAARQAAKDRAPLSLGDAHQMFETGGDPEVLAVHLQTAHTKAATMSDPIHFNDQAYRWAHAGEKKPISAFGKTVESNRVHSPKEERLYRQGLLNAAMAETSAKSPRQFYAQQRDLAQWYYDLLEDAQKAARGEAVPPRTPPEWLAKESIASVEKLQELEQTLGQRAPLYQRGKKPAGGQGRLFGQTGEDLPLFSGTAERAKLEEFVPQEVQGRRQFLPGMEPTWEELSDAEKARRQAEAAAKLPPTAEQGTLFQGAPQERRQDWIEAVLDETGTTYNFDLAAFIMPDGKMASAAVRGKRALTHPDIIKAAIKGETWGADWATSAKYLDETGAIRISKWGPGWAGIQMTGVPTTAQKKKILELLEQVDVVAYDLMTPGTYKQFESGRFTDRVGAERVFRRAAEIRDFPGGPVNTLFQHMAHEAELLKPGIGEPPLMADLVQLRANGTRKAINQMVDGLKADWPQWKPQQVDRATRKAMYDWLYKEVQPSSAEFRATALQYAASKADDALLNYNRTRNFDTWLSYVLPYHYWYTRSGWNWAQRLATNPALLSHYVRIRDMQRLANEEAGRRSRFSGKFRIPFPWEQIGMGYMGDSIFIDPMRTLVPYASFGGTNWDDADEAKTGMQKIAQTIDSLGVRSYHFLDFPMRAIVAKERGETPEIGNLFPITRAIKGATAALRQVGVGGERIPPGGVNIESGLRGLVGLPAGDIYDPYRISRMLANISAEQPKNRTLARQALMAQELVSRDTDQRGRVWEKDSEIAQAAAKEYGWSEAELYEAQNLLADAMQKAGLEQGVSAVGWLTGMAPSVEPRGEQAQLRMAEQARGQAWTLQQPQGSRAAYEGFKQQYPAMYPRGQQYDVMPGEKTYEGMGAGDRANWLAAKAEKERINADYDAQVDKLLKARPWDWTGRKALNDKRYVALDAAKAKYPYETGGGEIPSILYGMNPAEMWDSVVDDAMFTLQEQEPDADDFKVNGEVNWDAYYKARDEWLKGLPAAVPGVGQVAGGQYRGMSTAEVYENWETRNYSPIEAANRVYQKAIASPAWDKYHAAVAERDKDWPGMTELEEEYQSLPAGSKERSNFLDQHPGMEDYWAYKRTQKAQRETQWPGLSKVQEQYYSYAQGSQQRRDFLAQHPELKTYWDAKRSQEAEADARFPGMSLLEQQYYNLPEGSSPERKAFLKAHPRLKDFWDYKRGQPDPYDETVGTVGSVKAAQLIADILAQYKARGWTEEQLRKELAGVVFPPLSQQKAAGGAKGGGATAAATTTATTTGYAAEKVTAEQFTPEQQAALAGGDWRKVYGAPWYESRPGAGSWSPPGRRTYSPKTTRTAKATAPTTVTGDEALRAEQFRTIVEANWPEIETLQTQYFQVPKAQRQAWLAQHPELKAYWDFKDWWDAGGTLEELQAGETPVAKQEPMPSYDLPPAAPTWTRRQTIRGGPWRT
jgi:hypothetical protein